ncbi:MAG: IclR family transcriptional regulator [Myxococcales bacterium]|nr:IclR family transcriptional regulator [Myxococcales bacterium]
MGSVTKAFEIVKAVTDAGSGGLTFTRIIQQTGLPKATAHRLVHELSDISVLSFDAGTRCYRGGLMLARLSAKVSVDYDLCSIVRPHLEALQRETGHVATLGVRNHNDGVYADKIEPNDVRIRLHSMVGKNFPLHCTAMGKVLLAYASSEDVRRISKRQLTNYTKHTITDGKLLRGELSRVREEGYALDREEITRGFMCVAAPIYDAQNEVTGAMSCTFPSYISVERSIRHEIEAVIRHAKAASGLI